MLPLLLPLAGRHGILGAALSGAGPAVLVVVEREESIAQASTSIRAAVAGMPDPELLVCPFECEGANRVFQPQFRVGTESIP
jgi:homoserine kinase